MNEYEISFYCGGAILLVWLFAYLFSWAVQCAWAFIDDSKVSERNWFADKVEFSKYKYPLHNEYGEGLERAIREKQKPFAYSKNKRDKDKRYQDVAEKDKKYDWQVYGGIFTTAMLSAWIPFAIVLSFNFYPVFLFLTSSFAVAYLSRFARRSKKLFDKHVNNKEIHKA